jgi:hypothetical protein
MHKSSRLREFSEVHLSRSVDSDMRKGPLAHALGADLPIACHVLHLNLDGVVYACKLKDHRNRLGVARAIVRPSQIFASEMQRGFCAALKIVGASIL